MNIGMITAGALYLGPLRRELIRNGNRCQSFAFASTFFAGASRIGYDLVVVNWSVLAQDGHDVIKRLRRLAGDVVDLDEDRRARLRGLARGADILDRRQKQAGLRLVGVHLNVPEGRSAATA